MPNNLTPDEIQARIDATGEPLAYIEGLAYFCGHKFIVTPDVLIPRPETELLIDLALTYCQLGHDESRSRRHGATSSSRCDCRHSSQSPSPGNIRVLDLCTGSGCIGISISLARPDINTTCSDISQGALSIAKQNAETLGAKVKFIQSDLFENIPDKYNIIVTNPPYVDHDWSWLNHKSLNHEPAQALYADNHGLAIIKRILKQARNHLKPNGKLFLECDPTQHQAVIDYASKHNLTHQQTEGYILEFS